MSVASEPRSPRRRRTRALRSRAYLDAAMAIVATDGLDALTMGRLAHDLDEAAGTVYGYFPGKDALVAALQREAIDTILERYRQSRDELDAFLVRRAPGTVAAARALHFSGFLAGAAIVLPEQVRLLQLLVADPREIVPGDQVAVVAPAGAEVLAVAEGILRELPGSDPRSRAVMWVAALMGVIATRKLSRLDSSLFDSEALAQALTRSLLRGWGVSDPQLRRALDALDGFSVPGWSGVPPLV